MLHWWIADNRNPRSLASRMRRKRFARVKTMIEAWDRPITILDVGGSAAYWDQVIDDLATRPTVTLLNLDGRFGLAAKYYQTVTGDARHMPQFADQEFDLVFSNSVIEHIGEAVDEYRAAAEMARVGKTVYVQTPNYWFPIEPHWLVPGWQWLPIDLRVWLVQRRAFGWMPKLPDPVQARASVLSVRLMKRQTMEFLFPHAEIEAEKLFGLTKSWIAVDTSTE